MRLGFLRGGFFFLFFKACGGGGRGQQTKQVTKPRAKLDSKEAKEKALGWRGCQRLCGGPWEASLCVELA